MTVVMAPKRSVSVLKLCRAQSDLSTGITSIGL